MCGRRGERTTLPNSRADFLADRPIESGGPTDDNFGYRVTEEGMKALAEYEELHGKPMFRKVRLPDVVAEALRDEAWRERTRQRRKRAKERGHRLLTVCGRSRDRKRVPELRLMGLWLRTAGFDPGRQCEIEVEAGTLTIRAI
ncbi:MAG TPA: SymE family type I addiction module toxin [Thermoanaerobaculia bacterium]|nr:SymE family type I addiction module toxin [Thermoanaerobaculia bacterium]